MGVTLFYMVFIIAFFAAVAILDKILEFFI